MFSEYTSFLAIEERDESDKIKPSTTPQIADLLATDIDSKAIDILPYMAYITAEQTMTKPEDTLMQLLKSIDPKQLTQADLIELIKKYEEICSDVKNPVPIRIKYASAVVELCDELKPSGKDKTERILERFLDSTDAVRDAYPKLSNSFEELKAVLKRVGEPVGVGGSVYVKTLTGKTVTLTDPKTIEELKKMIEDKEGLKVDESTL